MAAADLITCATPRLAEEMAHYNPAVTVVPNGLPAAILDWPARQPSDRVTIGWAGSPSTAPELLLAAAAVDGILARPPARVRLGFHTIGVDPTIIGRAGLRNPFTRVTRWIPHSIDYLRAVDFDIWIAPYRPTRFNEAKVATKAIEAAFLGIPIVASDTEPYRAFVRHGETGLLVRRPGDWSTHLRRLAGDPSLRERMGNAARDLARDHTIDAIAPLWERALTGATA
jgi:glycosyltransferase involved in cell wall biosynthesis